MSTSTYQANSLVSQQEWNEARQQLLAKEKEATRLRDEISRQRRELPWVRWKRPTGFRVIAGRKR